MSERYQNFLLFFRDLSIRTKLIISVAFIILLMGVMMGSYLNIAQTKMMTNELNEKGYSITRNLAYDSANPILLGNNVKVSWLVDSVKQSDSDVVYVFIADSNGGIIAHTFENGFPIALRTMNSAKEGLSTQLMDTEYGHIRDISYPILNRGVGEVHVGISQENIISAVNRFNLFFGIFLFIFLLLGMNIAYVFGSFISSPILELKDGVESFGDGNLHQKVEVTSNNEVGDLAQSFNKMVDHISVLIEAKEKTAKELLEARNYLTKIVSGSIDGIVVFNSRGIIEFANEAFLKIVKCESDEVVGKNIDEIINEDIGEYKRGQKLDSNKIVDKDHELTSTNSDGILIHLLASVGSIEYDDHLKYVAVTRDVTELRKLDEMKKNIVSNISHELRTPLNIMRGYVELSLEEEDIARRNSFLEKSLVALEKQNWMIQDLLEVSRDDTDGFEFDLVKINLNGIIETSLNNLNENLKSSGVVLNTNFAKDCFVKADSEKLVYALNKIIDNALKFTSKGGSVEVGSILNNSSVSIYVKDSGTGISKGEIHRIFDKFYQVDGSSTRRYGGNGLGLAIAKKIVDKHNAKLFVDSIPDVGSTFYIDLPYFGSKTYVCPNSHMGDMIFSN